jgi:hypothetical protein
MVAALLRIHDQAVALGLEPHQLTYRGGYQKPSRDKVVLEFFQYLVGRLAVRVPTALERLTGVPVRGLVSYQE